MTDIREALRQVIEGGDFDSPESLLAKVSGADTCRKPDLFPYSIATNVAHCDAWNRVWLANIAGEPKVNPYPDFPVITPAQWPAIRKSFLDNLTRAMEMAQQEPFVHHLKTEESARRGLLKVAIHTSYHLGQIKLLKRMLRSAKVMNKA